MREEGCTLILVWSVEPIYVYTERSFLDYDVLCTNEQICRKNFGK